MAKFVKIGALVEKHLGASAFENIYQLKGVEYAYMETGRSNDLFEDRQFGQFGEAAILTMVVEAKEKNNVLERLIRSLNIDANGEGLVFEETDILKVS